MKKFASFTLILFSILLMFGCGGAKKDSITGKWEITKAEGSLAEANLGTIYEFTDDSKLVIEKGGFKNQATYKLEGNSLSYSIGTINVKAEVKIEGDKMNFNILGSDQKFELVRK